MKHGKKLKSQNKTPPRPVKLAPMVSANVTTVTPAHQAQLDLLAHQAWTANQEHQANQEPKENQEWVVDPTSPPPKVAENALQDHQDRKDLLDQQAKAETKADQVATEVWAKTEVSDQQDQQDQPETQAQMANQDQSARSAKMVSSAPKVNQVEPEVQAQMVVQAPKETTVRMVIQAQQVQQVHQAPQVHSEVQDRKARLASQVQQESQAKTPNTVLAHDEAIKDQIQMQIHVEDYHSQLFQFMFQISVIVLMLENLKNQ